ncbi:ferrochelatase [Brevibacterium aurantiacum]|uniref:Coproporphyrin III ferrochelatase n=1 Tax=Brevibacterium aurantiacum TaxID=273384 RepID=A0A3T0DR82_BREAU|nr:ferrochelatase [Brevibacterium aurantiacum]AZT97595.1 ferrochelatase [Brevibacterium aurantiacum]
MNKTAPIDTLVLMSFGGPEAPEEVVPFLKNVTAGRGIPEERLEEVGEHYYGFGGKSPINDQNKALLQALREELERRGIDTPLIWGNRNWEPYLTDEVRAEAEAGRARFLSIDTSAYSSYSSCRQYREDFAKTIQELSAEGTTVTIDKIRQFYNHPGYAQACALLLKEGLVDFAKQVGALDAGKHRILFVTHSIPNVMQDASAVATSGYQAQHEELMAHLLEGLSESEALPAELVYCSRSGSPEVPWLEPDVNDRMRELSEDGVTGVVLVPIGFISDHMEVAFDLDTEAKETAAELDFAFTRVATVGTHPLFVSGLVDLVEERIAQLRGEQTAAPVIAGSTALTPGSGACSIECCRGRIERATEPNWPA